MTLSRRDFAAFSLAAPLAWSLAAPVRALARTPLVIAAGAATPDAPAATRGAYDLAITSGADVIAASVFPTRDGRLVVLPGADLSATTDVAARPEFADRRKSRSAEEHDVPGWSAEDFTLAELKTLVCVTPGAKRRGPDAGRAILTFEELMATARAGSVRMARVIGLEVRIVEAARWAALDLAVEPRLATAIRTGGYNFPAAAMVVTAEEPDALRTLGELTRVRRAMRLRASGAADQRSPDGLKAMRGFAEAIAADPALLLDLAQPKTLPPLALIADAHAAGLAVQAWTIADPAGVFPPPPFRAGDARRIVAALFAAGCDAVAGDNAALLARGRDEAAPRDRG